MIDAILWVNGAKFYEVWAAQETTNPVKGSKTKVYQYLTQVYGVIQEAGTQNLVKGEGFMPTDQAGDKVTASLIMYSKEKRNLKERICVRTDFYEIRNIEVYDNGILKFYKSSLVKVDRCNDKSN